MVRKTITALAIAATASGALLAPQAASADQRGYAHVHQQAPTQQPLVDPGTALMIELGVALIDGIIEERQHKRNREHTERCYDSHGYYIC